MAYFQPVVFRLGKEKYGLNIASVNAIERSQTVVRVPNASRNIKGIINLRGEVIPVVNLKNKFNSEATGACEEEYIIINLENSKIALEVDGVDEIHSIDSDDMVEMPIIARGSGVTYFEKIAKIDNELIIMVNPFNLLSDEEMQTVEQLAKDFE